jgi:hypothetical protein
MKKLLVVLSLVLASFSFQASAATLTWGAISGTSTNATSGGDASSLFGSESGLRKGTVVNASWEFILDVSNLVTINISSLKVNPTWLTYVKLDGVAIPQIGGPLNGAWLFDSILSAGSHVITLGGTTNGPSSGYQLNVQTPIPAAIWLFGSALMGLTGLSRRKTA